MLLNEVFETIKIPLEEGIVFFKNSKKMKRLANTILLKSQMIEDDDKKKQVVTLINKINRLADKFQTLETLYKTRKITGKNQNEIKQQYKTVETEYADIVELAKKEQMKSILKNISMYAVMVATMIVPTLIIAKLSREFGIINPITNNKELNPFLRAGVYMTSAAALRAVSPTEKIDRNVNKDVVDKSINSMENKHI